MRAITSWGDTHATDPTWSKNAMVILSLAFSPKKNISSCNGICGIGTSYISDFMTPPLIWGGAPTPRMQSLANESVVLGESPVAGLAPSVSLHIYPPKKNQPFAPRTSRCFLQVQNLLDSAGVYFQGRTAVIFRSSLDEQVQQVTAGVPVAESESQYQKNTENLWHGAIPDDDSPSMQMWHNCKVVPLSLVGASWGLPAIRFFFGTELSVSLPSSILCLHGPRRAQSWSGTPGRHLESLPAHRACHRAKCHRAECLRDFQAPCPKVSDRLCGQIQRPGAAD